MSEDEAPRFYPNPHRDGTKQLAATNILADCKAFVNDSLPLLEAALEDAKSGDVERSLSMYTGLVGIAMAIHRIDSTKQPKLDFDSQGIVSESLGLASESTGIELYGCWKYGGSYDLPSIYFEQDSDAVNEVIYGRAGLAVMIDYFLGKGLKIVDEDLVFTILDSIDLDSFPWSWYDQSYYGAAHGTAGILLALKRINDKAYPELFEKLIQLSALPSGNFLVSKEYSEEELSLVQWCHGAAGMIPLLLEYRSEWDEICEDNDYESEELTRDKLGELIHRSLDLIWEQGLLTKGAGVCHGIAGNGYSFLAHYHHTRSEQSLYRAQCFAQEILKLGPADCCKGSDNPWSLFEGLAGTAHFMLDLVHALEKGPDNESVLFDGLQVF